jgi:hypothetical protein
LAGDLISADDGVVIADPGNVTDVTVEAKLKSVLAESGVDLLDCGLGGICRSRGDDDLGINVR